MSETWDPTAELMRYLQRSRDGVLVNLDRLSEHDIHRPLTPTGTSLLGLVKHLAGLELAYLGDCVGRPAPVPLPWTEVTIWEGADMWATAEETRDDIVGFYRAAWAHADASITQLGLGAPARVPWWPEERRDTTLGALVVRMVAETAQHAGHADLLREMLDPQSGRAKDDLGDAAWDRYVATVQAAADTFR
jgi:hypothetical protein